jgi:hypothetical protein
LKENSTTLRFFYILVCWINIVLLSVVILGGFIAGVGVKTLTFRSAVVVVSVSLLGRVLIKIISVFEEV